jgi:hypothetical protein
MAELKENFNYKHAKSSWLSASQDFKIVLSLAQAGEEAGSIDDIMRNGEYGDIIGRIGAMRGVEPGGAGGTAGASGAADAAGAAGASDFLSCVPLLYMLLNGIELYVKAYEYAAWPERQPKAPRKFPELLATFKASEYPKDEAVVSFIDAWTAGAWPDLPQRFLDGSGLSIADLLGMRRHISANNLDAVLGSYRSLPFTPEEGREFFKELKEGCGLMIDSTDGLFEAIDDDGNPNEQILALRLG